MKRKLVTLLLVFALALSLAACGGGGGTATPTPAAANNTPSAGSPSTPAPQGEPSEPAEITVAFTTVPNGLDPVSEDSTSNQSICFNFYDRLCNFDADNNLLPGIATSWEKVDNVTWKFEIDLDNYSFHNGDPLTMDDLVYSLLRLRDVPKHADTGNRVDSITYEGNVLTIKFIEENNSLLWRLLTVAVILNKNYVEANGDDALYLKPIGTGPYKVTEFVPGTNVILERWDDHLLEKPQIDKITFVGIQENAARYIALETGQIQLAGVVSAFEVEESANNSNVYTLSNTASKRSYCVVFNTERAPFDNVNVRRALIHAVDRATMCALRGGRDPVKSLIFNGWSEYYYDPTNLPEYDLDKAKEMLEAEGFTEANPLSFEILTYPGGNDPALELFQSTLESIGVKVTLTVLELSVYLSREGPGDFDVIWCIQVNRGGHFLNDLDRFDVNNIGSRNLSRFYDERVQEIVEILRVCNDPQEFKALTKELNDIIGEEAVMVGLFFEPILSIVDNRLTGVTVNGNMLFTFKDAVFAA